MKMFGLLAVAALVALFLGACSQVKLSPGGEQVQVLKTQSSVLDDCKKLGSTTVSADNINVPKENAEREVRARNGAADMGGNYVTPDGEMEGQSQKWAIYKCN